MVSINVYEMSTLVTHTLAGVRIGGKGVYTGARGYTYRGQAIDAKADGLGVLTCPDGRTYSGGWSVGVEHGHAVVHYYPNGAVVYILSDRDTVVHFAHVLADGVCLYDGQRCAADDARLRALSAAALPVAVRRMALAGRSRSPCNAIAMRSIAIGA